MLHEGTVTATVFKRFLQRLLIGAKRPIFLIVDGHPTHKAKLVKSFVESTAQPVSNLTLQVKNTVLICIKRFRPQHNTTA